MNPNKYPSLEWCEKYGHLFPESDYAWHKTQGYGAKIFAKSDLCWIYKDDLDNCPDALEIMEWLWEKDCVQIFRVRFIKPNEKESFYDVHRRKKKNPTRIEANTPLEALTQAVELVEKGGQKLMSEVLLDGASIYMLLYKKYGQLHEKESTSHARAFDKMYAFMKPYLKFAPSKYTRLELLCSGDRFPAEIEAIKIAEFLSVGVSDILKRERKKVIYV